MLEERDRRPQSLREAQTRSWMQDGVEENGLQVCAHRQGISRCLYCHRQLHLGAQPSCRERKPLVHTDLERDEGVYRRAASFEGGARAYCRILWSLRSHFNANLHSVTVAVYHSDNTFDDDLDLDLDTVASRNDFVQLRDIRRIEKDIEAETVRLHPDDGQSTLKWVERLRAKGHVLGFKAKSDLPPPQSGLAPDVFVLMIQTGGQRKMFQKYGNFLLCVDATHNTTMYEN